MDECEKDKIVGVLICDQSAAFDLCDHNLLIEKLKLLGMEDTAVAWMWSYLSGRQQSCFVDGNLSAPLNLLSCGVPQGSIGGPLLWLCFTCDQPDTVREHQVVGQEVHRGCVAPMGEEGPGDHGPGEQGDCGDLIGYVDDGAYSYSHSDPLVLSAVLSRKYTLLEGWINANKLVINADKTHLLVMGPRKIARKRDLVSIQAGPYKITPTETEKLLGCNLHQSLQWKHHIKDHSKSMIKQISTRINGLKKISQNASFNTRLMIANGAVLSKLVYMISVL